jgi:hypothetical protein
VLAAIKNIHILWKCETRQHGGGNGACSPVSSGLAPATGSVLSCRRNMLLKQSLTTSTA